MTDKPAIALSGLTDLTEPLTESVVRERADRFDGDRASAFVGDYLSDAAGAGATHVTVVSSDGSYRASIPLAAIRDGARLIVGSSGSLDDAAGGPFRFVVEDGQTLCWNVKGVGEMRFASEAEPDSVPENPTH